MMQHYLSLRRFAYCLRSSREKVTSSRQWFLRHTDDPYLRLRKLESYRCRSAFKLLEINEKYPFLKAGMSVLDLGAYPGSWSQVLVKLVNATGENRCQPVGCVTSVDKKCITPIIGAQVIDHIDLMDPACQDYLCASLVNGVDAVVSDAAPNATGSASLDHECIVNLCLSCLSIASRLLKPDSGVFLCKIWQGYRQTELAAEIKKHFSVFRRVKPNASRKESAELYFMGERFKKVSSQVLLP
uniref:rRNA methyltransferase 2, mitochondrial n=1 Tax=Trichuris muris TaxID=70415 RepID=A0A5S6QIF9_TRIMR